MFASSSCVHATKLPARCLTSQKGSKERHRFIVGTCGLHESNEISVLEYDENSNQIEANAIYNHPDQVWSLESSPTDTDLIITSHQSRAGGKNITMWRMPHQSAADINDPVIYDDKLDLKQVSSYRPTDRSNVIQDIKWNPKQNDFLMCDCQSVTLMTIGESNLDVVSSLYVERNDPIGFSNLNSGCSSWDPHNLNSCAAVFGSTLQLIDTRKMESTCENIAAHSGIIR